VYSVSCANALEANWEANWKVRWRALARCKPRSKSPARGLRRRFRPFFLELASFLPHLPQVQRNRHPSVRRCYPCYLLDQVWHLLVSMLCLLSALLYLLARYGIY
jgi:hypothetical protein